MKLMKYLLFFIVSFIAITSSHAQAQSKLLFREDWKEMAATTPVTQEHVANPDLILSLYGPAKNAIKKSNHPNIPNDPFYIWSGECMGNWALTLRPRNNWVDLTGNAKINWRAKQSGFRHLRVIVKLNDGNWLISDQYDGLADDWREKEFMIANLRWRKLNIETVTEGNWVENPDLSKVEEIGFTDLMAGGGTPASSRLDWIEVYGKRAEKVEKK